MSSLFGTGSPTNLVRPCTPCIKSVKSSLRSMKPDSSTSNAYRLFNVHQQWVYYHSVVMRTYQEDAPDLHFERALRKYRKGEKCFQEAGLFGFLVHQKLKVRVTIIEKRTEAVIKLLLIEHVVGMVHFQVVVIAFKDTCQFLYTLIKIELHASYIF